MNETENISVEKNISVEDILSTLERDAFNRWYEKSFEDFITGDMAMATGMTHEQCREVMKKELARLLGV
jgi:hypothetical protein